MKCTPGISERTSKFILHIIWCLFQATRHFHIWICPIYKTASARSKFPSSIMLIILKGHSVTPPGLLNLLYCTHFQMRCRNNMWKWPVNGCAILHSSDFCGLILTEEGAWWGPHLGKSFPPHNGQRQISQCQKGCFQNHSSGVGKPSSTPGTRLSVPPQSQALERAQSSREASYLFLPHRNILTFLTTHGSPPYQKTFRSCDLLGHIVKLLRSKRKDREESSSSPDLQWTSLNQQSQHLQTAEWWHFANIISVNPQNSPGRQVVFIHFLLEEIEAQRGLIT